MAENTESPTDTSVTTKQETSEVLDANGNNLQSQGMRNLEDIFKQVETGTPIGEAVSDTMKPTKKEVLEEKKAEDEVKKKEDAPISDLDKKLREVEAEKSKPAEEEEVTRESLRKKADKKEESIVEATKPEDDAIPEEELQVLQSDKPKTARRIEALLRKIKEADAIVATTKKEVSDKAAKLLELETKLSTTQSVDPVKQKEIDEKLTDLSMLRRRYELDKDPEVKSRFDDRIADSDKAIPDILKRNGAGDGLLKLIDEEGGWHKFTASRRVINMAEGKQVTASELADTILQTLPLMDRKSVEASMMERVTLSRERTRYFEEQQKTANDYFKKKEEESVRQQADSQQRVADAVKEIDGWKAKVLSENEFLKEKSVPSNATAEQKASIEDDNRYTKQLNGLLNKSLSSKALPEVLDMVLDSVRYYQERRVNDRLSKENSKLKQQLAETQETLDKHKSAGRTTQRSGSIAGGGNAQSEAATRGKQKPQSLEEALNRLETGESIISTNDD